MSNHTLRTFNIIKQVPGIADNLQINIAYEHVDGLTYGDAKAFERNLEIEIQAALFKLGKKPKPAFTDDSIRFIPISEALEITKHPSTKAFSNWKIRHNKRHPEARVVTRPGLVELNSLRRAFEASGEVAA